MNGRSCPSKWPQCCSLLEDIYNCSHASRRWPLLCHLNIWVTKTVTLKIDGTCAFSIHSPFAVNKLVWPESAQVRSPRKVSPLESPLAWRNIRDEVKLASWVSTPSEDGALGRQYRLICWPSACNRSYKSSYGTHWLFSCLISVRFVLIFTCNINPSLTPWWTIWNTNKNIMNVNQTSWWGIHP